MLRPTEPCNVAAHRQARVNDGAAGITLVRRLIPSAASVVEVVTSVIFVLIFHLRVKEAFPFYRGPAYLEDEGAAIRCTSNPRQLAQSD